MGDITVKMCNKPIKMGIYWKHNI